MTFIARIRMLLLVLSAVWLLVLPVRAHPLPGAPAPDFKARDIDGKEVDLAALRGRIVILEWTNHECPYTRKHYETGNMQRLQREMTEEHDAVWISIVSSAPGLQGYVTPAQARRLTAERGAYPSHVILDPEGRIGRLYHARTTPHMFVIAPDGTLAYMGAIDDRPTADHADVKGAHNYVREAVAAILAGQPVPHPSTRPYGCTVKYAGS
ncbi:MAG: thioredoxin family protein [Alphaproteobacteria bacterium]|nr:MAG: thioredoxin family protein [Alphaproteobacteria bacterium]